MRRSHANTCDVHIPTSCAQSRRCFHRGMVEVIVKLQEAARKAEEAAARLESGEAADDAEGDAEEAAEEEVPEEEADDSAPAQADPDPEPSAAAEAPAGERHRPLVMRKVCVLNPQCCLPL